MSEYKPIDELSLKLVADPPTIYQTGGNRRSWSLCTQMRRVAFVNDAHKNAQAWAEYIALACNSHCDLIAACEAAIKALPITKFTKLNMQLKKALRKAGAR